MQTCTANSLKKFNKLNGENTKDRKEKREIYLLNL